MHRNVQCSEDKLNWSFVLCLHSTCIAVLPLRPIEPFRRRECLFYLISPPQSPSLLPVILSPGLSQNPSAIPTPLVSCLCRWLMCLSSTPTWWLFLAQSAHMIQNTPKNTVIQIFLKIPELQVIISHQPQIKLNKRQKLLIFNICKYIKQKLYKMPQGCKKNNYDVNTAWVTQFDYFLEFRIKVILKFLLF